MKNPLENQSQSTEGDLPRTAQFYRKRKALLFLPVLLVPLITLGFANFHHGPEPKNLIASQSQGLNTSVPGAKFDKHEKNGNKMSFYDQAKQDSLRQQSNNNNPALRQFGFKSETQDKNPVNMAAHNSPLTTTYTDPNVVKINQKLADINKQINQPQTLSTPLPNTLPANKPVQDKEMDAQINKLETLMRSMNNTQGDDPQMQQLSKMLEQIQAIQHPELIKTTAKPDSVKSNPFKAIAAVIDGKQKIKQGAAVKLRLNDTIIIKGQVIPKGTALYATAGIANQRLLLEIKNIRLGTSIIPTDLTVYYTDGMPGVPAPEAELSEAASGGADQALQSMQFLSMDQSLATQAAAGGISAAKSLFSKKILRIKVHLKDGEAVLLRNNKP